MPVFWGFKYRARFPSSAPFIHFFQPSFSFYKSHFIDVCIIFFDLIFFFILRLLQINYLDIKTFGHKISISKFFIPGKKHRNRSIFMIHILMLIKIRQKVKCRLFLLFCIENCNFQINIYISFVSP